MFVTNGLPAQAENTFQILIEKKKKAAWEIGNYDSDTDFHSLGQVTWILSVTETMINYLFWLFEWLIFLLILKCFDNEI